MDSLRMTEEVKSLGIEQYAEELEETGLTVLPPEANQFGESRMEEVVQRILDRAQEMTGVEFSIEEGPLQELEFPTPNIPADSLKKLKASNMADAVLKPTQFLIQKLTHEHRIFRDLALNPASIALQNFIMAGQTRLSSVNCFVKWQGDFGYGPTLGLHADQGATPTPWGAVAHSANSTWCLTDYTLDGGALAYIPGSHKEGQPVPPPDRVKDAVPVEAPKGSLIVFHGATWHGAFPRKDKGLRLGLAVYHRHAANLPQEDLPGLTVDEMIADTDNPKVYRAIAGVDDKFPYREEQTEAVPQRKVATG